MSADSNLHQRSSGWRTVTGPMAWCPYTTPDVVGSCNWAYHGDADPDGRRAIAAARKHQRESGHPLVIVERGQTFRVGPDA